MPVPIVDARPWRAAALCERRAKNAQ